MPPCRPEQRLSQTDSTDGSIEAAARHVEDPSTIDEEHVEGGSITTHTGQGRDEKSSIASVTTSSRRDRESEKGRDRSKKASNETETKPKKTTKKKKQLRFAEAYMDIQNLNDIPVWLAPLNFMAAIFQLLQSVFIFAFSVQVDLQWCVYTFYPNPNIKEDAVDADIYAVPEPHEVGCYSITWLAGFAIFLSGAVHSLCVLPCLRVRYEYYIQRHQNPFRWIEYSNSCPLMRVHIAQVAGVTDLYTLILIFFVSQGCIWFGWMHEKLNAKNRADGYYQDHTAFWMSCGMHVASWGVIFAYFIEGMAEMDKSLAYSLVISLFLLELTFPVVFTLQWLKVGPFEDYVVGEFAFCVLSFTTKTFLAWATLLGANSYAHKN